MVNTGTHVHISMIFISYIIHIIKIHINTRAQYFKVAHTSFSKNMNY